MNEKPQAPFLVETFPAINGGWTDLGGCWITNNVFVPQTPLSDVRVCHLQPSGENCRGSGGFLTNHKVLKREPLSLSPSLACGSCKWHGFVTDGKWVRHGY